MKTYSSTEVSRRQAVQVSEALAEAGRNCAD